MPDQLVLASSRAVYGEGAWQWGLPDLLPAAPQPCSARCRCLGSAKSHGCIRQSRFRAVPPERSPGPPTSTPRPNWPQEHILAAWAAAHDTHLSVLRLQNVYGPGQSLTNSYTGIVALFARLAREQHPLEVYEDGRIVRDFVSIDDVVEALFAAIGGICRSNHAASTSGQVPQQPFTSWPKRLPPSAMPPNPIVVAKFRDGDVRAAKLQASSRRKTSLAGVRSGRGRTVCALSLIGSAS